MRVCLFLFLAVNVNAFRCCLLFSACRQEVLPEVEVGDGGCGEATAH